MSRILSLYPGLIRAVIRDDRPGRRAEIAATQRAVAENPFLPPPPPNVTVFVVVVAVVETTSFTVRAAEYASLAFAKASITAVQSVGMSDIEGMCVGTNP